TARSRIEKTIDIGWNPVANTVPIGPGVAQGRTYINPFIPSTLIKNLQINTFTTGEIMNGIKKYGFNTIGAANSKDSFTANIKGTTEVRTTAFNCLNFFKKKKIKNTIKIA